MNRNKSTHVRKFGGVWFQLVVIRDDSEPYYCPICPFSDGDLCRAPNDFDCSYDGGFDWGRSDYWKEIGER